MTRQRREVHLLERLQIMEPTKEEIIAVLQKAQKAAMAQDFREAVKNYQWVETHIQDDPDNLPFVWMEIAWAYYALNNFKKTIHYLKKALQSPKLVPLQVVDCMRIIGFSYNNLGDTNSAITYLQDALLQKVDKFDLRHIYFELGKIFFGLNAPGKAKPYLKEAQELFGSDEGEYQQTTTYYLGFVAFLEGDISSATQIFNKYLKNAPDEKSQAPGLFGLAHTHFKNEQYEKLLELCKRIIDLDTDFYDKETIAFFLNKSYMELEMWTQLEMFLPELLKNYPGGRYKSTYPQLEQALKNNIPSAQSSKKQ